MALTNPWLNYFQRSFQSIKDKLITNLKLRIPEITDYSEGNGFVIILSLLSAIAESLHYYIDNMARETFFVTARKYSSLIKHVNLVDYHIKCANPSSVDIMLYLSTGEVIDRDIVINQGTIFTYGTIKYSSTKPIKWQKGTYGVSIPTKQWEQVPDVTFGVIENENIVITLGDIGTNYKYVEGSMVLELLYYGETENWVLVETFSHSKHNDNHFKVEVDSNQEPYIIFGDGIFGRKPRVNSTVKGSYYRTLGTSGSVGVGTMVSPPSSLSDISNLACTNRRASAGHSDYEDFDMIKAHLPLHVSTMRAAVNKQDYIDLAMLSPGVDKAYGELEVGRYITLYITPDNGGYASQGLLDSTLLYIQSRKVMGITINVKPVEEQLIFIEASITGKKSARSNDIKDQVIASLITKYNYNTSDIAKPVRLSDIYALIDNLNMVDYLTVTNLWLKPIFTRFSSTVMELNADIKLVTVLNTTTLLIRYNVSSDKFMLLNANSSSTGIELTNDKLWHQIIYNNNEFSIKILPSETIPYTNGDIWKFTIMKTNVDQMPNEADYAIPLFKGDSQAILTIKETV